MTESFKCSFLKTNIRFFLNTDVLHSNTSGRQLRQSLVSCAASRDTSQARPTIEYRRKMSDGTPEKQVKQLERLLHAIGIALSSRERQGQRYALRSVTGLCAIEVRQALSGKHQFTQNTPLYECSTESKILKSPPARRYWWISTMQQSEMCLCIKECITKMGRADRRVTSTSSVHPCRNP